MPRRPLAISLIALAAVFAVPSRALHDAAFDQIDSIVRSLSDISGLAEEHPVPYGRMNKPQLRKFLNKRIKRTLKPEEIHADEMALKMFGLVPDDFDLKKSTVDLLTEQAAAFYDYDDKKLFLMNGESGPEEQETLAHELSHALADQHFDLEKYMDDTSTDDDANLARTAVVEGQASWLMVAYALKQQGKPSAPTEKMLADAFGGSSDSLADYPVLKASPLYIQQSLLFPYDQGVLFFNAVFRKEGKEAFPDVFLDPPQDTSQILHPELYFNHIKAVRPSLPSLPGDALEVTSGTVGEFDHQILLWQYLDQQKAADLAPHLKGGQFRITQRRESTPVLLYASEWDSPASAAAFFSAYQTVLQKKWRRCEVVRPSATIYAGQSEKGYFAAHLFGSTVTSVEGLTDVGTWMSYRDTLH